MPTLPVDHGRDAAHWIAAFTSACSPGPTQSRQPVLPPKPRRSTMTYVYPRANRPVPVVKSENRLDGPVWVHPSGPVWPACPKYGPTARITGVFALAGRLAGRSTSACSSTPLWSADGKYASVQTAPSGTRGFSSCVTPGAAPTPPPADAARAVPPARAEGAVPPARAAATSPPTGAAAAAVAVPHIARAATVLNTPAAAVTRLRMLIRPPQE